MNDSNEYQHGLLGSPKTSISLQSTMAYSGIPPSRSNMSSSILDLLSRRVLAYMKHMWAFRPPSYELPPTKNLPAICFRAYSSLATMSYN